MEVFYTTIAIVFGILLPIILVAALVAAVIVARSIPHILELRVQELKKQPPFDEVEVSRDLPNNKVIARFIKNDEIIWQGDVLEALNQ